MLASFYHALNTANVNMSNSSSLKAKLSSNAVVISCSSFCCKILVLSRCDTGKARPYLSEQMSNFLAQKFFLLLKPGFHEIANCRYLSLPLAKSLMGNTLKS